MSRRRITEIEFPHGNHFAGFVDPTPDATILAYLNGDEPMPCASCGAKRAHFMCDVYEKGRPVYVCEQPLCIGLGMKEAITTPEGKLASARLTSIWQKPIKTYTITRLEA